MACLPAYPQGLRTFFHSLHLPGNVLRATRVAISSTSLVFGTPAKQGGGRAVGCPALSPRKEEGLARGSSLSRCVWGAGIFAPPFAPHPELSAVTPGARVPLGVGEALTAGLPSAGTGD